MSMIRSERASVETQGGGRQWGGRTTPLFVASRLRPRSGDAVISKLDIPGEPTRRPNIHPHTVLVVTSEVRPNVSFPVGYNGALRGGSMD